MTFVEMLNAVLSAQECTLARASTGIGISTQYLHDLKSGRRLPSVEVTDKICAWLGRGPDGRAEWHVAAARAHGWKLPFSPSSPPPSSDITPERIRALIAETVGLGKQRNFEVADDIIKVLTAHGVSLPSESGWSDDNGWSGT